MKSGKMLSSKDIQKIDAMVKKASLKNDSSLKSVKKSRTNSQLKNAGEMKKNQSHLDVNNDQKSDKKIVT